MSREKGFLHHFSPEKRSRARRRVLYHPSTTRSESGDDTKYTMCLTFKFKKNTKSWFKNNLGRLLAEELKLRVAGEVVHDNTGESILETYKELWKSDDKRESMIEYGMANQNIRKILSKNDSGIVLLQEGETPVMFS